MHAIPTKRLLVYVVTGLVVLVVGTLGLLSVRGGAATSGDGVIIEAGDGSGGGGTTTYEAVAVVGAAFPAAKSGTTSTEAPKIWVQVTGAVRRPGVYQVAPGARVFEVVIEAGGFTDEADEEAIALATQVNDGCVVQIPRLGEMPEGMLSVPTQSSAGIAGGSGGGAGASGSSSGSVSLNTATLEQLDSLPGIGPSLAQQIVSYRETRGPFTSIEQLTDVPGIGPAKLEQLRPLVGL